MVVGGVFPTLTLAYQGLVNGDAAASLDTAARLATHATASSPLGSYPIVASGASDADYAITYVDGTFTIRSGIGGANSVLLPIVRN